MSAKGARILQIIAVCLFVLVLAAVIAAIPFQEQVKAWYNPELRGVFSIPYQSLLTSIVLVFYAGLCLVLECVFHSVTGTKVVAILMIIGYLLLAGLFLPAASQIVMALFGNGWSSNTMASYLSLENGISLVTNPLRIVASGLMLVSFGGFYGKPSRR